MAERFARIGVVEGFYGPLWAPAARLRLIERLHPFGLNTYLYAPKHEPLLGAEALRPPTVAETERLAALAAACAERGIDLWVGLHFERPLNPADEKHLATLADKLLVLADAGVRGCAVLFDDVPASLLEGAAGERFGGSLARAQGHAFTTVHRLVSQRRPEVGWLCCPSRYTLDPLLERHWGPLEPDYLAVLHGAMPAEVPWFWTGPRVCSPTVTPAHLAAWLGTLPRRVVLWDNYPVNDVAMVDELHLGPLSGRDPALAGRLAGYLFNPLLQPELGAVPGATCLAYANDPAGYAPQAAWADALERLLPAEARAPFAALEELTRRSCLEEPPGPLGAGPGASLGARLRVAWEGNTAAGTPPLPALVAELREVLGAMERHLPAALLAEARPWLARLADAAALLEAAPGGAAEAARAAFARGRARVLGDWFLPSPLARRGG